MKRGRASSSDDESGTEAEEQSLSVSDYDLVDDDDTPVSFAALPIQWSDSENSDDASTGKVFLQGLVDDGLRKFFTQVTAWRFDLSCTRPEIFLLSKDGKWIELQKPRKIFQDTIRTIMITIHFLHRVKRKCQMSAASVWQDLCKDKELSSYGVKPSQKDLLDHLPLIREASKRDAVLAKSKFLLMVLEKPKSQKLIDKEVNDVTRPELTVVGIDRDMIDEYNEELEEKDDLDVCAICDNGGNVTCCDGVCMRSFHATVEAGRENNCVSLGFTQKEVDDIQNFYCKNCEYHQHQCFACGKLGSSDKVKGAEVIKCSSAACDRFYHPHCVAKLLSQVVKHVAEELERNITDGDPFTCPLHFCGVCKELENKRDPELQFAVCRRCPKSYHRKCLPREIAFGNKGDEGIQRAWEGLLPNNRILIYCLNHEIDHELGTPVRDHIKFPNLKATVQKIKNTIERKKPASKERAILKKKNVDFDNSSSKSTAKGSKLTGKVSSDKFDGKKSNKVISASNISRKPKLKETSRKCSTENNRPISKKFERPDSEKNHNQPALGEKYALKPVRKLSIELPPLDADSEKSLLALFKEARSSITMESILEKHTFDSTHTQSLKNVVEKTITMEKLEDSVDAVRSALRKLENGCSIQDVKAVCDPDVLKQIFMWKDKLKIYLAPVLYGNRYTSYIVDKLHWYVQNGDMIVDFCCGANDFSILMKKKLEETVKKCSYRNYDLLPTKNDFSFERRDWMTVQPTELPTGSQLIMGLRPPFGHKAALANKFIDKALEFKPKLIILIVPPETERQLDKKPSPYDLIWEEENFLSSTSFYLPGSVEVNDTQVDQTNERPLLLSLWSRPDWTIKHKIIAQEHGHACSQNKVLETQSFYADIMLDANYAADDQASKKGQQRSSHCGNADEERVNGKSSDEALQPKSTLAYPRVEVAHNPSCGPLGSNNEQDVSETESSCKTNIPVIGQYEPRLCELKLVKSSLASETRPLSKSGRRSSSVPKPVYGGGMHCFAPALNCEYARQHSCGWLDE
uniref:Histone-lysine N-methyltransferase NSD3 n=1 Tax=Cajanus cajan TaxID=3821 RepID=A0A151SXI6_CAJCA|nr:Histone-lysine N-methyltransferase NSD3 [Cajanus cajan]